MSKQTHEEFLRELLAREKKMLQQVETDFEKANIEYAIKVDLANVRILELEQFLAE